MNSNFCLRARGSIFRQPLTQAGRVNPALSWVGSTEQTQVKENGVLLGPSPSFWPY